jgi:hypothetical protein
MQPDKGIFRTVIRGRCALKAIRIHDTPAPQCDSPLIRAVKPPDWVVPVVKRAF